MDAKDELERLWQRFYELRDRELMRQCLAAIGRLMVLMLRAGT